MVKPPATQVNKLTTFLPEPNPKLTHMKAGRRKGQQQVAPIPFLNPDPIACLIGHSNEAPVIIDGQEVTALIHLGAQVLSISVEFCKEAHPANLAPGLFIGTRGDRGCSHPIPWISGGKPPDSWDKKL